MASAALDDRGALARQFRAVLGLIADDEAETTARGSGEERSDTSEQ